VPFFVTTNKVEEVEMKQLILMIIVISLVLFCACAPTVAPPAPPTPPTPPEDIIATPAWMNIELTDVATGQKFKISDFKGKFVLLESFAVWCPACLEQQKEMKKIIEATSEYVVLISLDTDPNEDEAKIKIHTEWNDLNWFFAVSPEELTRALIDEFGLWVISAPSTPIVLICRDQSQSTRFLESGLKSADTLLSEIGKGCN